MSAYNKFVGTSVPALDLDSAAETLKKKFGITLHRVNRKIKTEINGVRQSHKPWKDGTAVFTCDEKLGSLGLDNPCRKYKAGCRSCLSNC